jgi:glycosyltransferase involved in cell wall biosynthesis
VGINASLVKEGINGFLAKSEEEWYGAFEKLYQNEALRRKMADINFRKIEDEYNNEKNCQYYAELIQSVADDSKQK